LERLLEFAARDPCKVRPCHISEAIIADWVRDIRKFGATSPAQGLAGLKWCVHVLKLPWDVTHAAVRGALHRVEDVVDVRAQPIRGQAKMLSADQARALERFLAKAAPARATAAALRVRFGAGILLFGLYASRRLSCLDRLGPGSLHLTCDAVCAESYKQKNKPTKSSRGTLVFGAPRRGLTGARKMFDWGAAFMAARARYAEAIGWDTIDTADFLIPEVAPSGTVSFASKAERLRLFRDTLAAAGINDPNLRWGSLRPLLNTTAAQRYVTREDRALLGNWSSKSGSVDVYDRALGARELMVRSECLDFHRQGGKLGGAFELPKKALAAKRPSAAKPTPKRQRAAR